MERLPRGANFQRSLMLWQIGLHVAGDPNEPYYGNRDMCISVGSGSAENFRPWLRMSTGSPIIAHAVAEGDLEMSMVNPSAFLTQAYQGHRSLQGTAAAPGGGLLPVLGPFRVHDPPAHRE